VIKDDHMPAEPESKPGSWLVYTTVAGITIPILYAISWRPVGALAANHPKFAEVADAAYTPMSWLESNTQLSTPLDVVLESFQLVATTTRISLVQPS
jgi:hypothetical protein